MVCRNCSVTMSRIAWIVAIVDTWLATPGSRISSVTSRPFTAIVGAVGSVPTSKTDSATSSVIACVSLAGSPDSSQATAAARYTEPVSR